MANETRSKAKCSLFATDTATGMNQDVGTTMTLVIKRPVDELTAMEEFLTVNADILIE